MKGIWKMLMGDSSAPKQAASTAAPLRTKFMELYERSADCVCAQDALVGFYEETAMIGGGYSISDDEARRTFENILSDESLNAREKDAYLSALDVAVQNHHTAGMGADVVNQIHAAQYELLVDDEWKAMCKNGGA